MNRRRLVALAILPTLLVGAVVAVTVVLGARAVEVDVERADRAATDYRSEVEVLRARAADDIAKAGLDDPAAVAVVVDEVRDRLPELPDVPQRGAQASEAYRAAVEEQAQVRRSLDDVEQTARTAVQVQTFVDVAEEALAIDPQVILPETSFVDGTPVRQRLVARVREAVLRVEAVPVPESAVQAATTVKEALADLLRKSETLAAELDAGRSHEFEYGSLLAQAAAEVEALESATRADLREAVDRLVGEAAVT